MHVHSPWCVESPMARPERCFPWCQAGDGGGHWALDWWCSDVAAAWTHETTKHRDQQMKLHFCACAWSFEYSIIFYPISKQETYNYVQDAILSFLFSSICSCLYLYSFLNLTKRMCRFCPCLSALKHLSFIICSSYIQHVDHLCCMVYSYLIWEDYFITFL